MNCYKCGKPLGTSFVMLGHNKPTDPSCVTTDDIEMDTYFALWTVSGQLYMPKNGKDERFCKKEERI